MRPLCRARHGCVTLTGSASVPAGGRGDSLPRPFPWRRFYCGVIFFVLLIDCPNDPIANLYICGGIGYNICEHSIVKKRDEGAIPLSVTESRRQVRAGDARRLIHPGSGRQTRTAAHVTRGKRTAERSIWVAPRESIPSLFSGTGFLKPSGNFHHSVGAIAGMELSGVGMAGNRH